MTKAITDGLALMPPPFAAGLGQWSSGLGTPGSDTYAASGTGAFVPADQDFGGCLEIAKTLTVQRVRFMGQTPIRPGMYLRVTARVKAMAGTLPVVRVSGYAAVSGGAAAPGAQLLGPATQLTAYGEVVEITAIIGTSNRTGVDMRWTGADYGHLGIEFSGPNGGIVRVDDITVEDVTNIWVRDLLAVVDVRDYGAIGNGVANDAPAFLAADAAADGRTVLVSEGTYFLNADVTFQNEVKFEGTVIVPGARRFILQRNYDYNAYLAAFGGNEEQAFRKAYQALLNFADHEGLDLNGRRISLTEPMDMQACDPTRTVFNTRRVIRNGQFQPVAGPAWNDAVATSAATYNANSPETLTNVVNIANIQRGSRVTGNGVGREIYVREVNVAQQRLTLSAPLFGPNATQTYTFRRHRYLLDFSGYDELSQFIVADIELQCNGTASGILLARQGLTFHLRDCFVNKPKDRGISSIGLGCQGMLIDRCQFLSNEQPDADNTRTTIGLNANANDVKIRDNRAMMFKHFAVLGGSGSVITGNHWFQGDTVPNGTRQGGMVFTTPNTKTFITGNYIDNNFIEMTNEHSASPDLGAQFSFGGITITGNIFTANDVASWFNFIVIKPYGTGHFIHGLTVTDNVFRTLNGNINRIERVDTTFADLDFNRMRNVTFTGNVFHGVTTECRNPLPVLHTQSTLNNIWVADTETKLPFSGRARVIESVVAADRISNAANATVTEFPWTDGNFGSAQRQFRVIFNSAVRGAVRCMVRMDNPE